MIPTRIAGRIAAEHPQTVVLIPVISAVVGARRVVENQDTTTAAAPIAAAIAVVPAVASHRLRLGRRLRLRQGAPLVPGVVAREAFGDVVVAWKAISNAW